MLLPIGLLALAVLLRAAFLDDRQLFRDEAASWLLARYPLAQLVAHAAAEPYPPLYALVLKGWIWLAGDSEAALRSLSTLFGLAVVVVGWRWATESLGRGAGLIALALLALSPLAIANARDARMYAMDTAWTTAGWWLTWRLVSGRSEGRRAKGDAVALALVVAAELWTFSFGLPVAALQFAVSVLGWIRNRQTRNALAPAAILAGGGTFLPWLPTVMANAGGPFWTPTPGLEGLGATFTLMIGGWGLPWIIGASIVLALAAVGMVVINARPVAVEERTPGGLPQMSVLGTAVIAGVALVPLVWLYSQFHSFYDGRYFGASVAPLILAAAGGCCWAFRRLRPTALSFAASTGLALLVLGGTLAWLDQWRSEVGLAPAQELLAVLERRMQPGDVALSLDARSYFQVAYLLGRQANPVHLPGRLYSWSSGDEPFYYGQSLLSPADLLSPSEVDAGWQPSVPGLAPGGRIWLIALANGTAANLGFRPLDAGDLGEVGRTILAPAGEPGQLLELVVTRSDVPPDP